MKSVQGKPVGIFHSKCHKLFMCVPASTLRPLQCCGIRTPIVQESIVVRVATMVVVGYLGHRWLPNTNDHYIIGGNPLSDWRLKSIVRFKVTA